MYKQQLNSLFNNGWSYMQVSSDKSGQQVMGIICSWECDFLMKVSTDQRCPSKDGIITG